VAIGSHRGSESHESDDLRVTDSESFAGNRSGYTCGEGGDSGNQDSTTTSGAEDHALV
jgi:hypothetical protein